jgi:hypothetical protein
MFGTNGTDENFRLFHLFQSASERAISQVKNHVRAAIGVRSCLRVQTVVT